MGNWYTCNIHGIQIDATSSTAPNPAIGVILTDSGGSFTRTAFTFDDAAKQYMLASAIAAISNKLQVYAYLDEPVAGAAWNCHAFNILA